MADLHRKYVCRSYLTLVETYYFGIPLLSSGGIDTSSSAGYDRKVPDYTEFLWTIQPRVKVMNYWHF